MAMNEVATQNLENTRIKCLPIGPIPRPMIELEDERRCPQGEDSKTAPIEFFCKERAVASLRLSRILRRLGVWSVVIFSEEAQNFLPVFIELRMIEQRLAVAWTWQINF